MDGNNKDNGAHALLWARHLAMTKVIITANLEGKQAIMD